MLMMCWPIRFQRIVRIKKMNEDEEEGGELTEEEIEVLSQGTAVSSETCLRRPPVGQV